MFTFDKEVPLFDVFENIAKEHDYMETISHKSSDAELRAFMEKALPNYDTERVYVSDIKKLSQWYNILHKAGYITPESFVKAAEEAQEGAEAATEEKAEKKPAAKKAAPKAEQPAAPKAKASSAAKSTVKSTQRKQG